MKKLYILALMVGLSFGQRILSADEKKESMFSKAWYEEQLKENLPRQRAQQCPNGDKSCLKNCTEEYFQKLISYQKHQATKDCSGFKQFFNETDKELFKECVFKKLENENNFVKKHFLSERITP